MTLVSQVLAPPGTIHDGAGSGWESLALGPDGRVYPSPALVGVEALATDLAPDLKTAWHHSPVLTQLRRASAAALDSPWRFFLGGGDPDHSYVYRGTFVVDDPYLPLYEKLALWLAAREAAREPDREVPGLRLKMGEVLESCGSHGAVALTHSNNPFAPAFDRGRAPGLPPERRPPGFPPVPLPSVGPPGRQGGFSGQEALKNLVSEEAWNPACPVAVPFLLPSIRQ